VARKAFPSAAALADLYSGDASGRSEPRHICLHEERPAETACNVSTDVDSMLAFPTSLAALKGGLYYCPTLQHSRHIRTDVHLSRTVKCFNQHGKLCQRTLGLRDIPHLYLGSIPGIHDCALYILFPRLWREDQSFTSLTQAQMTRFTDEVMWECLEEHVPPDVLHHLPADYRMSQHKATARHKETRTGQSESGYAQNRTYFLQPQYLQAVWLALLQRVSDPGGHLQDFADPILFVTSKGHKLQFKAGAGESLHTMLSRYMDRITDMFDLQYIPNPDFFSDFASEVCAAYTQGAEDQDGCDGEPQVYLGRRCCLDANLAWLYGDDEAQFGNHTWYHVAFLRDACNLTSVPQKRSELWKAGVRYCQFYAVEKEISDAGTTYPFTNPGLEELALDARVWHTAASSARWTGKRSRAAIVKSYINCKQRIRDDFVASRSRSFGFRCEIRADGGLLAALLDYSFIHEPAVPTSLRTPLHVWTVSTTNFANYIVGNVNKLCAALEMVSITSPPEGIRHDQTRLMYALLKCLRHFLGQGDLAIQPSLWYSEGHSSRGLGFEATIERAGYAWFEPVIDWARFRFTDGIGERFAVREDELLGANTQARDTRNGHWDLDAVLALLVEERRPRCQEALLLLAMHSCFRRFRQDVLGLLLKDAVGDVPHIADRIARDQVGLCYDEIHALFVDRPSLVSGNRSMIKTVAAMVDCLWGSGGAISRTHWDTKPFRVHFSKVRSALSTHPGLRAAWESRFSDEFLRHHWLLPYPDGNGTIISTAKHTQKRQWFSILPAGAVGFSWGKAKFRPGSIPPYPPTLLMSASKLQEYLAALS
jgi:hypothetical protein